MHVIAEPTKTINYFVFYGTLRDLVENDVVTRIGDCVVGGFDLYDYHGSFPAAVPGEGTVKCVMYHIATEVLESAFGTIDHIEGYIESDESKSLYLRRVVLAFTEDQFVDAWMYIWNHPHDDLPRVLDGRWRS